MEYVLISAMAAAFVVAVLREFPTPPWVDGAVGGVACIVGLRLISQEWLPVQTIAAFFATAFLGMLVRSLTERQAVATRRLARDLRSQVPRL